MPKLPVIKSQELVKILKSLGFIEHRQKGSHLIMKKPNGERAVVPMHQGRDIPPGTLKAILNDINLSIKKFIELI